MKKKKYISKKNMETAKLDLYANIFEKNNKNKKNNLAFQNFKTHQKPNTNHGLAKKRIFDFFFGKNVFLFCFSCKKLF